MCYEISSSKEKPGRIAFASRVGIATFEEDMSLNAYSLFKTSCRKGTKVEMKIKVHLYQTTVRLLKTIYL